MDDPELVSVYGNLNLPVGSASRPLVSLLLIAYNQERYVRAAIEGAFAQEYSPLEIILSDDCSPDRTFAIMEEMAREYRGEHKVLLVEHAKNLGLIGHVNDLLERASGEILVLAAGDDISLPNRVGSLVRRFAADSTAKLIHSNAVEIDKEGRVGAIQRPPATTEYVDPEALAASGSIYIGATGAFKRELFETFGP
ncbi:MAG: glycosyltransferase, partial [Pseudomonadota bacterium]